MSESTPPNTTAEPSDDEPFYRQPWARFAIGFSVIVMLSEVLYQGVILESDLFQYFVRGLAEASGAILTPFYDIEYGAKESVQNGAGDEIVLHDSMSYSSFVLVPAARWSMYAEKRSTMR